MKLEKIWSQVSVFEAEAHKVLGKVESVNRSRIVLLDKSYNKLETLSLKQDDMFRQSLRCIENGVFRAAVVLSWAALVDYFQEYTSLDGFASINFARPKWKDIKSLEDIRDNHTEYHQIEAMHAAGQISKSEKKALHGLRNRRNECAHPSDYYPSLNEALGYFSEAVNRIDDHRNRTMRS